ncbi:MAG: hypothetical protein IJ371_04425 [Clostridia bacterium]|nr:hypothetical protein [Clostridia bacterium]
MNNDQLIEKDLNKKDYLNIEQANQEKVVSIKFVKISEDLEMIKDESGIICGPDVLYFYVSKGGKVRHALRDAMGVLKTQKDKSHAILKYKEFEVSFGRDEKLIDILGYIYAIEDFMKNQAILSNPNFSPRP